MENPLDAIYWRDELLQILFWFRGEGLGEAVTSQELVPFMNGDEVLIQLHLDHLVDDGYVTRLDGLPPRYQLTEWGVKEGGRRFADEFTGLTGQAHGECNNPNCSCQTLGPAACAARGTHVH
jgi:hypothetical protein